MSGDWLRVRARLHAERYGLAVAAADDFPGVPKVGGTPLLTDPLWIPPAPIPLSDMDISLAATPDVSLPTSGYAATMAALDAPTVFENRPTWRLLEADLAGPKPRLVFGDGWYFDSIDTGEAAAHEYAAGGPTPLRDAIGNPCVLGKRPANLAISALTVRQDPAGDTFLLHWRDPAKVGHAGGLYQVVPVGVFQTAGADDFSLWRFLLREYAEELLGAPEVESPDYETWPFAMAMTEALRDGRITAHCLGLGVDPLTFATDLLVSVVIDAPVFDALFGDWVAVNDEGAVTARPFTVDAVDGIPMQAAGAALVRLALDARAT